MNARIARSALMRLDPLRFSRCHDTKPQKGGSPGWTRGTRAREGAHAPHADDGVGREPSVPNAARTSTKYTSSAAHAAIQRMAP